MQKVIIGSLTALALAINVANADQLRRVVVSA